MGKLPLVGFQAKSNTPKNILRVADKEEAKESAPDLTATSAFRNGDAPKFLKLDHCNFNNSQVQRKPKLVISGALYILAVSGHNIRNYIIFCS